MLHVATAVFTAGIVMLALSVGWGFLQRSRNCADCGQAMRILAPPDGLHTYEVLVCPACPGATTLSRGTRNRFAFCPRCARSTLQTRCERHADPPGQRLVTVHEDCQLCGYSDVRFVSGRSEPSQPPKRTKGEVLPFRRP